MTDGVCLKCALASPPPQYQHFFAPIALQSRGGFDKQPEHYSAIIVRQLDQPCFGDKAAEFDELARSFAALHLPDPRVKARPRRQQAVS